MALAQKTANFLIAPYDAKFAHAWDDLVSMSSFGTFLHTRKFLAYHGERFADRSVLIFKDNSLLGVFPAAVSAEDEQTVVSHPGATYGGLVHDRSLSGEVCVAALESIADYYLRDLKFKRLCYKVTPYIYHRRPASDDLYALFRLGAQRYRCDLSSTIDLSNQGRVSPNRRYGLNRALKRSLTIERDARHYPEFWVLLERRLATKHNSRPVHSLAEISQLQKQFPDNIELVTAWLDDEIVAGVVLFHLHTVCHLQYMAANDTGLSVYALDHVLHECLDTARCRGQRYFDFGISTESEGRYLNTGLYRFKSGFGAGSCVYEFYALCASDRTYSGSI